MGTNTIPANFCVVGHPLVQHNLSLLRDKDCPSVKFRALLHDLSLLMAYEVLRDLPLTTREITTPLAVMQAPVLAGAPPTIVPVLRAGLGMAEPLLEIIPSASVGHIGVYRDHETKKAIEYLVRLPPDVGQTYVIVDPMLATGNSLIHACDVLSRHGIPDERIRVMALVAAPEGVKLFAEKHPKIHVTCAAIDQCLNEKAYIVPGLGDAGDRFFGT